MKKVAVISSLLLIALFAVVFYLLNHILPYSPIKPIKFKNILKANDLLGDSVNWKKIIIKTKDSLSLEAYYILSNQQKNGTIIMLHGIADNKESMISISNFFNSLGFNTLLLDLRAHGDSQGEYCTFGYYEKYDVMTVIDTLSAIDTIKNIGIWGHSLGGAIAIQTIGIDKRLKFGIIQSTFDELRKVILEYSADMFFGLKSEFIVNYILEKSEVIANFKVDSVKPSNFAKNINVPMLYFHGNQDEKIPIEFNKNNFQNTNSKFKKFVVIDGAKHNDLWLKQEVLINKEIQKFLLLTH